MGCSGRRARQPSVSMTEIRMPAETRPSRAGWRLTALPQRGRFSIFELLLLLACLVLVLINIPTSFLDIVVLTFLWAGLALAWNIAGGYAGLISFGHAAFFGIGAYASTI